MTNNKSISLFSVSFKKGFVAPNIPIATVKHEDLELNFILDTGSDRNSIDSNIVDKLLTGEAKDKTAIKLTGVGGHQEVKSCSLEFQCGDKSYKADFLITDFKEPFSAIYEEHGIQLHGIIGSQFLKENNVVLDFQNLAAYSRPI